MGLWESPFHSRISALCESWDWRNWSGYLAPSSYQLVPIMEYYAIRQAAGLIDVSPLYKYRITGNDAFRLVNKVVTRDVSKLAAGQIFYTPWCDDRGKTVDDGTLWRFSDGSFRLTAAEPNLKWLEDNALGMEVKVEDVSDDVAALALQGPSSRAILAAGADGRVEKLKYYRFIDTRFDGIPVTISRTGYTGDLGYEIWTERENAERLWDALMYVGPKFGMTPAGLIALDIARIEAGLILGGTDYVSSRRAVIPSQAYSPFELGLDWTVTLEKGPFVGRRALSWERRSGPARRIVGLEVDWDVAETFYAERGLPPTPPARASREKVPVSVGSRQIGWASSSCWSPTLKQYIALATVASGFSALGTVVDMEVTVEGERKKAPAEVVSSPFFEPERKKA